MTVQTIDRPIEGKVVSNPSGSSRYGNTPRTQYIYVQDQQGGGGGTDGGKSGWRRAGQGVRGYIEREPRRATAPGWPGWMANRGILVASWAISMAVVGVDDWRNNNIMPRPSRLWSVSLFYGLLALASIVDAVVPIINALAVGYTIMLIWNYFSKAGQFA